MDANRFAKVSGFSSIPGAWDTFLLLVENSYKIDFLSVSKLFSLLEAKS